MHEWFCTNCKHVFIGGSQLRCCGQLEIFDLKRHGRDLIGLSNSWIDIKRQNYEQHPLYQKASKEVTEGGNYGASTIMITFINNLIEELGEQERNPPHLHNFVWKREDGWEMCSCGVVREIK